MFSYKVVSEDATESNGAETKPEQTLLSDILAHILSPILKSMLILYLQDCLFLPISFLVNSKFELPTVLIRMCHL